MEKLPVIKIERGGPQKSGAISAALCVCVFAHAPVCMCVFKWRTRECINTDVITKSETQIQGVSLRRHFGIHLWHIVSVGVRGVCDRGREKKKKKSIKGDFLWKRKPPLLPSLSLPPSLQTLGEASDGLRTGSPRMSSVP